jgi:hypothetical protein
VRRTLDGRGIAPGAVRRVIAAFMASTVAFELVGRVSFRPTIGPSRTLPCFRNLVLNARTSNVLQPLY